MPPARQAASARGLFEENAVRMSLIRAACAAALAVAYSSAAFAADMTPQERMKMCSAQNKGKKGDDYKSAQSACLKGADAAPAAPLTPQQRMAKCSAENKGKKGDDYKNAQSACLKG
jgi:hypothetical protein